MGRWVVAPLVLAVVLGVLGCGSTAQVGAPSSSNTSLPSSSPSASSSSPAHGPVLRGVAVTPFDCSAKLRQGVGGVPVRVPAGEVTEFLLCPMPSQQPSQAVKVVPGNAHFAPLLGALTAADAPRSTGICPMYADEVQVILAKTRTEVLRATIPVDGCGHYQHINVLMAARSN